MKNNKGFASMILFFIVIALVVWGAIWYSENNNISNYSTTTPTTTTTTPSKIYGVVSPRDGDQWVTDKNYSISLKDGINSDYHPLTQIFAVLDNQGKAIGVICPDYEMQKGARAFEWKAGNLMTACSGSGNSEIKMSPGEYQILFTEFDENGNKLRTEKSGVFSLY